MAATWEWRRNRSTRKDIQRFTTRPDPGTGEYGPDFLYDDTRPMRTVTLTAEHMDEADVNAEHAKVEDRDQAYVFTTATGETITGIPFSCVDRNIPGTDLYQVTVEVLRTD